MRFCIASQYLRLRVLDISLMRPFLTGGLGKGREHLLARQLCLQNRIMERREGRRFSRGLETLPEWKT